MMRHLCVAACLMAAAFPMAAQEAPKPGATRVLKDIEFVWVPAGRHTPGTPGGGAAVAESLGGREEWFSDESPRPEVSIKGFWMSRTEIRRRDWVRVMNTEPWVGAGAEGGMDLPATGITWSEAGLFAQTLGQGEEGVYRLPTEDEWEYACRAGGAGLFPFETDAEQLSNHAWFRGNAPGGSIQPVGGRRPNAWGLMDMLGNAWEWCADAYLPQTEGALADVRVIKGGAANQTGLMTRPAVRVGRPADMRGARVGFRIVFEPTP